MTTTTKRDYIAEHEVIAGQTFKDFEIIEHFIAGDMHRLTVGKKGEFANRQFCVVWWPGNLLTGGDNGECWWQRPSTDMLAWARSAINSLGYFDGKVVQAIPTKEWNADEARDWVESQTVDEDADENSRELYGYESDELLQAIEEGEHAWWKALSDSGWVTDDWPKCQRFTEQFLWARAAIKCALRLLEGK